MVIKEILLLHHSHLDVGYTHSQPILWELQGEYIDQVLDWLDQPANLPEGARPKWTCEATEPVRQWLARASLRSVDRFVKHLPKRSTRSIGFGAGIPRRSPIERAFERLLDGKGELEAVVGSKILTACQHGA